MVEITYLAIIGIAIAAMFFGYGFGLFEGRGQGYKKRKAEEEQETKEKPEPSINPATITVDDPGLMRIKNEDGFLRLDLDGTRVNTSSLSSDQRKRLIEMLNFIRPWLEGKPAPAPASGPIESRLDAVSAVPEHKPQPSSSFAPGPTVEQTQDKPASVISSSQAIPQPATKKDDKPQAPPTSMVGQINEILQRRIVNTPLATQGLTLIESLTGGVNVYVGMNRYEGIDAVPSEEIKAAIRAAISEWENKYTPGLK